MPASSATLDLDDIMDNAKLGRIQITVLVLSTLVTALEGFDLLAIAFAGPVIAREWSMSPESARHPVRCRPSRAGAGRVIVVPAGRSHWPQTDHFDLHGHHGCQHTAQRLRDFSNSIWWTPNSCHALKAAQAK